MDHLKILDAARATVDQRGEQYGAMTHNFKRIAAISSAILQKEITPYEIAIVMHALKLSRISFNPTGEDHYVDGINYLAFAGELASAAAEKKSEAADDF